MTHKDMAKETLTFRVADVFKYLLVKAELTKAMLQITNAVFT